MSLKHTLVSSIASINQNAVLHFSINYKVKYILPQILASSIRLRFKMKMVLDAEYNLHHIVFKHNVIH